MTFEVPDDRKPRGPRLSDEERDAYPRKTPPAGVQAALEQGAPLHEIGFEKTDQHDVIQLAQKAYARTKEQSGMLRVLDGRVDTLSVDVVGIKIQNKTLIDMNGRQLDILGDIARKRAATHDELARVSATSRWRIAVIIATGIFGTGGIAAIVAVALTKGC